MWLKSFFQCCLLILSSAVAAYACDSNNGATFPVCEKQANQGRAGSQLNLGILYLEGRGVTANPALAVYWFRKAAEQGEDHAQFALAQQYEKGKGVEKDLSQAEYWYRKAAEQSLARYQRYFGNFLYRNKKDFTQSEYWYRKAAEQGDSIAQLQLGFQYKRGEGVSKDKAQAFYWFTKAAEQGNTVAQFELGLQYKEGEGVGKDKAQAFYWFTKAAEQGDSAAQFNLGGMYIDEHNGDQAMHWLRKAADQGSEMAMKELGGRLLTGDLFPKDVDAGVDWIRKSAASNDPTSYANLGLLFGAGLGVVKDLTKAREYLERAAMLWQKDGEFCPNKELEPKENSVCSGYLRHLALIWQEGLGGPVNKSGAKKLFEYIEENSPGSAFDDPSLPLGESGPTNWLDVRAIVPSATLPQGEEQTCRPVAGQSSITFPKERARKSKRYFDAAVFLFKGKTFDAIEHDKWQRVSDILLQCGIYMRQLRIFSAETCQPEQFEESIGSAIPIYYEDSDENPRASGRNITITNRVIGHNGNTIAHEFGHLLGRFLHPHNFEPSIMQYFSLDTGAFTPAQCVAMRRSPSLAPWPAPSSQRADTSPRMPAQWKNISVEDRIKQLLPRNKLAALFYEFRPDLTSHNLSMSELLTNYRTPEAFSPVRTAMFTAKYDLKSIQALRMYEIAHNWPIEAGWPTEKTVFDLSGKPDLFWLPDIQTDNAQAELEEYRMDYRSWCFKFDGPEVVADQSTLNSRKKWCNSSSVELTHKRNLRPGDEFIIDPNLSSRVGILSEGNEVWLHGGDLFYVVATPKGREVVFVTPNAMGVWDGKSLDDVRKNSFYNRDWENPALNPVEKVESDVAPMSALRADNMGAPTPATLPGAKTVTPLEVWQGIVASFVPAKRAPKPLILTSMDDVADLPLAHNMLFAAAGGSFDDDVQNKLKARMQELGAQKNQPIVVYCHHRNCWLSYNLGLRLVNLGYTNVQWMRSGWDAWFKIGLPISWSEATE